MFNRPHLNASMQLETTSLSREAGAATSHAAETRDDKRDDPPVVHVALPLFGREEKIALSQVLEEGWVTMGSRVRAFELAFA